MPNTYKFLSKESGLDINKKIVKTSTCLINDIFTISELEERINHLQSKKLDIDLAITKIQEQINEAKSDLKIQ